VISGSSSSKASSNKSTAVKLSGNPYANYSTPESLGYSDLDAVRLAEEMARKQKEGVVGEWEVVVAPVPVAEVTRTNSVVEPKEEDQRISGPEEEQAKPADEDDTRSFKLRKKTAGLGDLYDPGLIVVGKKEEKRRAGGGGEGLIKKEEEGGAGVEIKKEEEEEEEQSQPIKQEQASLFRKRRRKA
jgi:WW domain-binding protein 4